MQCGGSIYWFGLYYCVCVCCETAQTISLDQILGSRNGFDLSTYYNNDQKFQFLNNCLSSYNLYSFLQFYE